MGVRGGRWESAQHKNASFILRGKRTGQVPTIRGVEVGVLVLSALGGKGNSLKMGMMARAWPREERDNAVMAGTAVP